MGKGRGGKGTGEGEGRERKGRDRDSSPPMRNPGYATGTDAIGLRSTTAYATTTVQLDGNRLMSDAQHTWRRNGNASLDRISHQSPNPKGTRFCRCDDRGVCSVAVRIKVRC